MAKTNEAALRQIESNYEKACNAWVVELARIWDINCRAGYWIGGEPGGVYDLNGEWTLGMQDIKYIVRNGITYEQASAWQEYVSMVSEYEKYGYEIPSLREYVEYRVPLLDSESQQRIVAKHRQIEEMKDELVRLCDEEMAKARARFADSLRPERATAE